MPCQAKHTWTFSGLVWAYLHLSIAFLLLCASTLAFFASKFLASFGLNLPCPCNGLYGNPQDARMCLKRLLVDFPSQITSSVHSTVKSKFPFDSTVIESHLDFNLDNERNDINECVGSEGEMSCISSMVRRSEDLIGKNQMAEINEKGFVMGAMSSPDVKDGRFEHKRKDGINQKVRYGLRRCRKSNIDSKNFSFISASNSFWSKAETHQHHVNSGDDKTGSTDLKGKVCDDCELNEDLHENKTKEKNAFPAEDFNFNSQGDPSIDRNAKHTIRILEKALQEEHAARAFLYVELEKERRAAATAAEETMAMILRLQEEKASTEMEAKQYQRMMEEKYAYDAEETNILKEILVWREREKYFLEKEVEAYRKLMFGNELLGDDIYGISFANGEIYHTNNDLQPTLQISQSVEDKKKPENANNLSELDRSNESLNPRHPTDEHHSLCSSINTEIDGEFQVKGLVVADKNPLDQASDMQGSTSDSPFIQSNTTQVEHNLLEKAIDQQNEPVLDMHADDEQLKASKEVGEKRSKCVSKHAASNITKTTENQAIASGLPPIGSTRKRRTRSDPRRKSMSAFDTERLKIDSEISWLRERLKTVRVGRDKLSFFEGKKEREKIKEREKNELQTLEKIASQLRELQPMTEPGRAARQASLPPLTSKVTSKKRRWRSGSGVE